MKQETETLLAEYRQNGWTVGDIDAPTPVMAGFSGPLIVPVHQEADYSPEQIRGFLGVRPDSQVISIHSGLWGSESKDAIVLRELARQFRKAGYALCNGGMPPEKGPMHNIIEGAFDQDSEDGLEPVISIVTEKLFKKDNRHGRYPHKDMRVLLIEDPLNRRHRTDLRADTINMIAKIIFTFRCGAGGMQEYYHEAEGLVLDPENHTSPLVLANLDNFFDGTMAQLDVIVNSDGRVAAPRMRAYSSSSADKERIVQDLFMLARELIKNPDLAPDKPDVRVGKFEALFQSNPLNARP